MPLHNNYDNNNNNHDNNNYDDFHDDHFDNHNQHDDNQHDDDKYNDHYHDNRTPVVLLDVYQRSSHMQRRRMWHIFWNISVRAGNRLRKLPSYGRRSFLQNRLQ